MGGRQSARTFPTWQLREQYVNGGLPVVETSQAPDTPVVPVGAAGHVVPVHFGRQHSWLASGKCTGESPPEQPVPLLPGFAQWFPAGPGGPGGGGGAGPPQSKPQIPLVHFPPVGQSALDVHPSVQSVGGGLPVFETSQTGFPLTPAPGAGQVVPVQAGRHTHIPCSRRSTEQLNQAANTKAANHRMGANRSSHASPSQFAQNKQTARSAPHVSDSEQRRKQEPAAYAPRLFLPSRRPRSPPPGCRTARRRIGSAHWAGPRRGRERRRGRARGASSSSTSTAPEQILIQ